jgi:hypothetical protein
MRLMMRSLLTGAVAALAWVVLASSPPVFAQTVTQSPGDQLSILQSMNPEDRDALMRSFGIDPNSIQSSQRIGMPVDQNGQIANPVAVPTPEELAQRERARTYLQPGDTVIVQMDFHLQPLPVAQGTPGAPGNNQMGAPTNPAALAAAGRDLPPAAMAAAAAAAANGTTVPGGQAQGQDLHPELDLPIDEQMRLRKMIDLVRARNPYQLARDGLIWLPGLAGIPLSGLTESQATLRLQSEPALAHVEVRVIRLPLDKTGSQALKPFGYDLFDQAPSTFAPVTDVPVPAEYIVGPGDIFDIQL